MNKPADTATKKKKPADNRTADQIRADIAARRARISANVEGFVEEVHPQALKEKAVDDAKAFASREFETAKQQIKDEAGWRIDRLVVFGGAALGVVTFLLTIRAIVNRSRRSS